MLCTVGVTEEDEKDAEATDYETSDDVCLKRRSKRNNGKKEIFFVMDDAEDIDVSIFTKEEFMNAHQDFCNKCGFDGFDNGLFLCRTCNLVWHNACNKEDMSEDRWQCSECINLGLSPDIVEIIPTKKCRVI